MSSVRHRSTIWYIWGNAIVFMIAWFACAYLPNPNTIGYGGLPLWFELSCLLCPIGFILSSFILLTWIFPHHHNE